MTEKKQKRYVMLIDIARCIGCHTCAIACNQGNNLPKGIRWNRVLTHGGPTMDTPDGNYPNLSMQYLTLNCQHCDDPPCVNACPTGATFKREDGIVMQNYDICLGCRMCVMACPYDQIRSYNEQMPAYYLDTPVGDPQVKPQQKGTVSKCNFCYHRVDEGLLPNCVEICPAGARFFGDINDPESQVSQILKKRKHIRLLTDQNTNPSIYFLTQ